VEKLFNPGNIAVIGASPHKEKLGYQVLGNIINNGYKGKIFPINPTANEILGLETFRTVKDINETIDYRGSCEHCAGSITRMCGSKY